MKHLSPYLAAALILPLILAGTPDSPSEFLPASGIFRKWVRAEDPAVYSRQGLYGHIDGGAEIFLQYQFEELALASYVRSGPKGREEITCEIYRMDSPDNAFGIFSIQRAGGETVSDTIPAPNWISGMQANAVRNRYYVNITGFDTDEASIEAFTAFVINRIPGPLPSIPAFDRFPVEKRVSGSLRLIRGTLAAAEESLLLQEQFWGFAGGTTAYSARYQPSNSKAVLIELGNTDISKEGITALFQSYLEDVRIEDGIIAGKNAADRLFLCRLTDTEAVLVLGENDPGFARTLIEHILNSAGRPSPAGLRN
jgi:hypothetical protein